MAIQIFELQFDKDGNVFQPRQEADALRFLSTAPGNQTTDVVVLSHGWNDDMDEARALYRKFLANLEALLPASRRRQGHSHRRALAVQEICGEGPDSRAAPPDSIPSRCFRPSLPRRSSSSSARSEARKLTRRSTRLRPCCPSSKTAKPRSGNSSASWARSSSPMWIQRRSRSRKALRRSERRTAPNCCRS